MKISNELKVGSLTIISIITLILGFYYLKGIELFSSTKKLYVLLEDAAGIVAANPVAMHGKQIGKVQKVTFEKVGNYNVIFDLSISNDVEIPDESIVKIIELDLLGNKELRIIQPDKFTGYAQEGDTLYGEIKGNIFASVENQISPILERTEPLLVNIDTLVGHINNLLKRNQEVIDATLVALKNTMENFEAVAARTNKLIADQSSNIEGILSDAKVLTGELANNAGTIDSILANFETLSANLSAVELEPIMQSAEEAVAQVNDLLTALNDAEGTLGKMVYDDSLYAGLDSTLVSINALIEDLMANPKRYVSFSLIERKDKSDK